MSDARYPIGPFSPPRSITPEDRQRWIGAIAAIPQALRDAVQNLSDAQLDTPYREGGWTVRQVVHHVADSHVNSYTRFRLALTEQEPTIKPYDEAAWAELVDAKHEPLEPSLLLLEGLHRRWVVLLESLTAEAYQRTFRHPETGRTLRLDINLALYAWHGQHHTAHITHLRERLDWH
jgi:uncharacterized damage-inducible protein DinB